MRLDVFLTPGELTPGDIAGRTVVVIDVLRASSTIVRALDAGARSVYPVSSIDDALRLANSLGRDDVLLCGERRCLPIEGFDMGNSPREFTPERVADKTLVMSTTNGTLVMSLTAGAGRVYIGSILNIGAVVNELSRSDAEPVLLCSGREGHFALEDAVSAGLMARRLMQTSKGEWDLNDGARAAISLAKSFGASAELFRSTVAGRIIAEVGLEEDLAFCAQPDLCDALPILHDRNISLAPGAEADRAAE
jgi:2-phosphosulfolactate phosphatase